MMSNPTLRAAIGTQIKRLTHMATQKRARQFDPVADSPQAQAAVGALVNL